MSDITATAATPRFFLKIQNLFSYAMQVLQPCCNFYFRIDLALCKCVSVLSF